MKRLIIGLLILVVGYWFYGRIIEKLFGPDDRKTPAKRLHDGVDYVELPNWKNMLIQLLNIAGIGPVIGVIIGIKFGDVVFLIIPVGCVLMGAVHDFAAGMMSLRNNGANLPELIRRTTTSRIYALFAFFMVLALFLVVAVFINIPAQLLAGMCHFDNSFYWMVGLIFLYYICATLFPVDKIIGKIYPIFGALLLLATAALFVSLLWHGAKDPALLYESSAFRQQMFTPEKNMPIIPMLFVTIACGILSGFHATQAPIVARTMSSERQARGVFFGMMIVEGFIGLVWAAGALAIYNHCPDLMSGVPTKVLTQITGTFLGSDLSTITVLSVVVLAITSGDTAMRSLRLSLAEIFHIDQKPFLPRILLVLPLIVVVLGLLWWSNIDAKSFNMLWNYFAWSNQVMAAFTLIAATIYLAALKKPIYATACPGIFITFVVTVYILWISKQHGGPAGIGVSLSDAYIVAGFLSLLIFALARTRGAELAEKGTFDDRENREK